MYRIFIFLIYFYWMKCSINKSYSREKNWVKSFQTIENDSQPMNLLIKKKCFPKTRLNLQESLGGRFFIYFFVS
jgi:hypothetical protein